MNLCRSFLLHCFQLTTLCLALMLVGCDSTDTQQALGTLERDPIRLTAPASQIITAVYVEEGDSVEPGQPLVQLDDQIAQSEIARAKAALAKTQAYMQELETGPLPETLAAAQARVNQSEATARLAVKSYQRSQQLVEKGLADQADLDQAQATRDTSQAALDDARNQLALLDRGTRSEQLNQARSAIDQARESLAIAEKIASDLLITATRKARVDSLPWKLGERVTAGSILVVLLAESNPYLRAYVPESARAELKVGQQYPVKIDGQTQSFTGRLTHIQQDPAFSPHYALTETERSRLMYLVKVQLDDSAADLPNGLPAQLILPGTATE